MTNDDDDGDDADETRGVEKQSLQGTDVELLRMERRAICLPEHHVMDRLVPSKFMSSIRFAVLGYLDQRLYCLERDDGPQCLGIFGIMSFRIGEAPPLGRVQGAVATGVVGEFLFLLVSGQVSQHSRIPALCSRRLCD